CAVGFGRHNHTRLLRGEGVSRSASRVRRSEWPLHRNGSRRIQLRSPCLPHGRRHARRPRGQVMTPDFDALRAERNAARDAWVEKMRAEGWELSGMCSLNHRDACYCACAIGGPCEHNSNGEPYESEDGCTWSATCSRCGMTAMSHSLRNCP